MQHARVLTYSTSGWTVVSQGGGLAGDGFLLFTSLHCLNFKQ